MVKSTRLIDIWLYINNHKKFTTTELAKKFNVSTRTIQRDILFNHYENIVHLNEQIVLAIIRILQSIQ